MLPVQGVIAPEGANVCASSMTNRPGVPAVPLPVFADQPWWAAHLVRLGTAPTALPYRDLSTERLSSALRRAVDDRAISDGASELADAPTG